MPEFLLPRCASLYQQGFGNQDGAIYKECRRGEPVMTVWAVLGGFVLDALLMFTDGNIVVRMLESVREHVLEGKAMHHCVGSGTNYSLNPDCIIFSARIAEQRVETVEFSLEQMKVVQCHGLQNKDTEHHADIINLVNSNARLIEQRMVATT